MISFSLQPRITRLSHPVVATFVRGQLHSSHREGWVARLLVH